MFTRRAWLAVFLGVVLAAGSDFRQAVAQEGEQARPRYSSTLNIEALIENYGRFLARRYNLTEEQDAYTQQYLREQAQSFLNSHRDEVFDLVDRMYDVRNGGAMDTDELLNWGRQALPLYQEAKALIVQGNNEWRAILNEDQQKIHDQDLQRMYDGFTQTEGQLERIVTGQMTVDEFRQGPGRPRGSRGPHGANMPPSGANPPVATGQPSVPSPDRRPGRIATPEDGQAGVDGKAHQAPAPPGPGGTPPGSNRRDMRGRMQAAARAGTDFESQWEAYVRQFIERYQLNEGQTQRAQAILKQCQSQANNYAQKRKTQVEQIDAQIKKISGEKDSAKEVAKLNERKTKLLQPINDIFEKQLKPRLERLPTAAQRTAAEAAAKAPAAGPGRGARPGGPGSPGAGKPPQPPEVEPTPEPMPEPEPMPVPEDEPMPPQPEPMPGQPSPE